MNKTITIITAPSILGLTPGGVSRLPQALLDAGLAEKIGTDEIIQIPEMNYLYSDKRDPKTQCLNPEAIAKFSKTLSPQIKKAVRGDNFPLVLGGDCSIIIGIMSGLKDAGNYGLIFIDAHADFYLPEQSATGQVADMDLAITTGRGSNVLTNIDGLRPYVKDENVIHIGQRDEAEVKEYDGADIAETLITCYRLRQIHNYGITQVTAEIVARILQMNAERFWIHFDTDVLDDAVNPAVDYRLPGGLLRNEITFVLKALMSTGKIAGISLTIYNPDKDSDGRIAKMLNAILADALTVLK